MRRILTQVADTLFPARRRFIEQLHRERDDARAAAAEWKAKAAVATGTSRAAVEELKAKARDVAAAQRALAQAQEERDTARRALDKVSTKAEAASRRVGTLMARLADRERRVAHCEHVIGVRRRSAPSAAVLRTVLSVRSRHRPLLRHDAEAAREREAMLASASAAYRDAVAASGGEPEGLGRMTVAGLPWWVPTDARMPERLARAERQGLPLKAILQTREVALGGVMLDIGANIGRTSIPRVLLGDVRAVWAAEPDPNNYRCLVRNVVEHRLQGFVLPDQVAIGATRGEVHLKRSRYIGGHRVMPSGAGGTDPSSPAADVVTVQCWPLDEWMPRVGVEPEAVSFVKVDTQGFEPLVLQGASALLALGRASWLLEFDPALLTSAGRSPSELLALLERHFTHFIDIGNSEPGPRVQPTTALTEAVAHAGVDHPKTDLLVFRA